MALWTIMMQQNDKLVQRLWSLWCVLMTRGEFQSRWSYFSCSSFSVTNGLLQTERNCTWLTQAKTSNCHLLVPQSKQNKHFSPPCSCLTVTFFLLTILPFSSARSPHTPFSVFLSHFFSSQVYSRNTKQEAGLQSKQCTADWYRGREKEAWLSLHDWV